MTRGLCDRGTTGTLCDPGENGVRKQDREERRSFREKGLSGYRPKKLREVRRVFSRRVTLDPTSEYILTFEWTEDLRKIRQDVKEKVSKTV